MAESKNKLRIFEAEGTKKKSAVFRCTAEIVEPHFLHRESLVEAFFCDNRELTKTRLTSSLSLYCSKNKGVDCFGTDNSAEKS